MSFAQEKLAQATVQTQNIFNLYVYEPDNGDTSTDVLVAGYWSQSRFIGTDGWVDGIIHCKLDDGFFMMQVQASGITVAQVGAGGGQIPQIETDLTLLENNVRGVAFVDMENDDYTLTDDEANAAVLVVSNSGDGTKTLTWPTTSDLTRAAMQTVVTLFCSNGFTISAESGGSTSDLVAGTIHTVSVPDGLGAFDIGDFIEIEARKASNGIRVLDVGDTVFTDANGGELQHANDGVAQTLTIDPAQETPDLSAPVYCSGAGGLTIQGGVGVTVTGNTVLAAGDKVTIYRDGVTENYLCV